MSEIAELIAAARDEPTTEHLERMWGKILALPAWYLLPAAEGPTTPLVAQLDEEAWIVAFTHFRPLNEFARGQGLRDDRGEIPMLPMAPAEAVRRTEEVCDHVAGILFNPGTNLALRAPIEALRGFVTRFAN